MDIVPAEIIQRKILIIRGRKVMLDRDLKRKIELMERKYDHQYHLTPTLCPRERGIKRADNAEYFRKDQIG